MSGKHIASTLVTAAATIVIVAGATADAAPGTLSDAPLFLTNPVEPNVLFLVDDSGSMDWGLMTDEREGLVLLGCEYYYTQPASDNDYFYIVPTEEGLKAQGIAAPYGGVWRSWNAAYNRIYYDPRVTYTPWPGLDSGGTPYGDANPSAAREDPYDPASATVDLTTVTTYDTDYCAGALGSFTVPNFLPARYHRWTDSDGDGVVDAEDAHTLVEIEPLTLAYAGSPLRRDCALAPVCSYAEEIQNFANWFSYYRKREYVAKAAYGQVIAGARNSRMGLVTLHNNASVNTEIASMNEDPASGTKNTLLDSLYEMQASGGTPLRNAYDDTGEYLSCDSNAFFSSCPALPPASGGECQQNFTVMMTDGFYNGGFTELANEDGDNSSLWDSSSAGPYGDALSNTLGDIAMEYYETDLRPSTDDKLVPPPGGIDENTAQHMVTYTVAFGVEGNVGSMPPDTTSAFAWPDTTDDAGKIDDLRHAAWNSRGEYHSAQNPRELIGGLRSALRSIQSRIGSAASVAFNTGSLSTNSEVYLALFNSDQWNGDLLAFTLDPNNGSIDPAPKWSAAVDLATRDLSANPRTILTWNGSDGIPLQWGDLTAAQQADFRTNPSGTQDNVATGLARHAHFRGDKACEFSSTETCFFTDGTNIFNTKSLRERNGRLGDIVHSGPVFVGTPESNWPDVAPFPGTTGDTYSEFRDAKAMRPGVVYVGGNDGMLHGFAQTDGEELLGYVPAAAFSTDASAGMHFLSDPAYSHRYYVDLRPTVADVYARTRSSGATSWKTVLVGGLRGGGRGLFALDVTDPTGFTESGSDPANTVMWEFTSTDDPDLGHTFSRPSIVPLEGPGSSIRWGVVVGNGYNDLGSGEAKLFVLLLEEGLDGVWTQGSDYVEISTGVGTTANRNGLSTPAVIDSDGDGLADRAYAGDLFGNLWAFDLSGSNTGNWGVAHKSGSTPVPMFVAPSGQQITSSPVVVRNSQQPTGGSNFPNTLVIFGTGQYLTGADILTTDSQAMYGVWDSGSASLTQSDLVEQTIGTGVTTEGVFGRTLTDYPVDYSTYSGWYMNLPDIGERVVTDPVIRGDLLFFNTMRPDTNPCEAGGSGWLMVAKWINGGRPSEVSFDLNNDGQLSDLDEIGGDAAVGVELTGIPTSPVNLANKRYTSTTQTTGGSTIDVTEIIDSAGPNTGRLSWEELLQ